MLEQLDGETSIDDLRKTSLSVGDPPVFLAMLMLVQTIRVLLYVVQFSNEEIMSKLSSRQT
jgi:hypothetical protein